jgi:hypothetical protein
MNEITGTKRSRRSRAEVKALVEKFGASELRAREFCEAHDLSLSVLRRHLCAGRLEETKSKARLVRVEVRGEAGKGKAQQGEASVARLSRSSEGCAIAVVLGSGRRIEVGADFDTCTLERVVAVLERA